MKAIVVAAGAGKRIRGVVTDRPKYLMEVGGKTICERQAAAFRENGITDINVVVGFQKERFKDQDLKYFVNTDYANNNILHSLFYAEAAMNGGFLFSYSDIVYEGDIIRQMLSTKADIAVAVDADWKGRYQGRDGHPVSEAELVFSKDGRTVAKIRKGHEDEFTVGEFLGLAYFSAKGAETLKKVFHELEDRYSKNPKAPFKTAATFPQAYMTDMFQELADLGIAVEVVKIRGRWCEIDTPQDLENARSMWKG